MYDTRSSIGQAAPLTSLADLPRPFFFVQYLSEECNPVGSPCAPSSSAPFPPLSKSLHRSVKCTTKDRAAACSSGRYGSSAKGVTQDASETARRSVYSHEFLQWLSVNVSLSFSKGVGGRVNGTAREDDSSGHREHCCPAGVTRHAQCTLHVGVCVHDQHQRHHRHQIRGWKPYMGILARGKQLSICPPPPKRQQPSTAVPREDVLQLLEGRL